MNAADLIAFEKRVKDAFLEGRIRAPIHLSGGNEAQLIEVFRNIKAGDWVLSTWRSHYHALLHGVDPEWLFAEILAGRSMYLSCERPKFLSSAIVAGMLPIATGLAYAIQRAGGTERVWCFLGDMAYEHGTFHEAQKYAALHDLPVEWVIEDNGLSTNTPTRLAWGYLSSHASPLHVPIDAHLRIYRYEREHPHVGAGKFVVFE